MIRLSGLQLPLDHDEAQLRAAVAKALGLAKGDIGKVQVVREAIDARKKPKLKQVVSVELTLPAGIEAKLVAKKGNVTAVTPYRYTLPPRRYDGALRPVVVGAGPAGLFAALILAEADLKPIVIEGGAPRERRNGDIAALLNDGVLDTTSNIEFGEGGAGLFSDGKLNTGTRDPRHRFILETLIACGAPADIAYKAQPHVGSDLLSPLTGRLRRKIVAAGGEFRFFTRLIDIVTDGDYLAAAVCRDESGSYELPCRRLILACGQSAGRTVAMLARRGLALERKAFSVGVRIEHRQRDINIAQYGEANADLTAAYKLAVHLPTGRSAYTFCMCPGGYVVPAMSEPETVVTNGMSRRARDGANANSALLVSVAPTDIPGDDPLGGIAFRQELEQRAYCLGGGGYRAPAQRVADFLNAVPTTAWGSVVPSYRPGVTATDLNGFFPPFIEETLKEALPLLGAKLAGFDGDDAVLTAVETRSSAPFRLLRDDSGNGSIDGVYPAGEGSGHAGGIMSAAADGIRMAEKVLGNP